MPRAGRRRSSPELAAQRALADVAVNGSTHYYEMDFLIGQKQKAVPIEIKSSATTSHKSMDVLGEKYSKITSRSYIFSQKDISNDGQTLFMPIYMLPFLL